MAKDVHAAMRAQAAHQGTEKPRVATDNVSPGFKKQFTASEKRAVESRSQQVRSRLFAGN